MSASNEKKITLGKLALMNQKEFLAIREDIADVRGKMVAKQELAQLKDDLKLELASKTDLESAKSYIVDEIKEFMQPHVKSLDTVLVDVEKLKEQIKI